MHEIFTARARLVRSLRRIVNEFEKVDDLSQRLMAEALTVMAELLEHGELVQLRANRIKIGRRAYGTGTDSTMRQWNQPLRTAMRQVAGEAKSLREDPELRELQAMLEVLVSVMAIPLTRKTPMADGARVSFPLFAHSLITEGAQVIRVNWRQHVAA